MGNFSIIKSFENFAGLGAEWVMWLMLGLGFVMIVLAIERLTLLSKTRVDAAALGRALAELLSEGKVEEARARCADGSSMEERVVADGLAKFHSGPIFAEQLMMSTLTREKQRFNRYMSYFGTIGNNTPFIGLFGTVIGIILAFKELGLNPKGGLEVIGPLIAEALVATAVGLFVAIPAVVIFNWFKSMVKERVGNTEFLMRIVLAYLNESPSARNSAERLERDIARDEAALSAKEG
jgi:biopolymer transport protein ExbB/TolQ